jgi:hypothetical protein
MHPVTQRRKLSYGRESVSIETEASVIEAVQVSEQLARSVFSGMALQEQVGAILRKNAATALEHFEFVPLDVALDEGHRAIDMFCEIVIEFQHPDLHNVAGSFFKVVFEPCAAPKVLRATQRELAGSTREPGTHNIEAIQTKVAAKFVEMNGQLRLRLEGNYATTWADAL